MKVNMGKISVSWKYRLWSFHGRGKSYLAKNQLQSNKITNTWVSGGKKKQWIAVRALSDSGSNFGCDFGFAYGFD